MELPSQRDHQLCGSFHNHPTPSLRAPFPAQTCLSFPPCIWLIWADQEFLKARSIPPPDVQRQELARAQL